MAGRSPGDPRISGSVKKTWMAGMEPEMTKGFVAKLAVGSAACRNPAAHLKETHVAQ
jgi:hypothetical protein